MLSCRRGRGYGCSLCRRKTACRRRLYWRSGRDRRRLLPGTGRLENNRLCLSLHGCLRRRGHVYGGILRTLGHNLLRRSLAFTRRGFGDNWASRRFGGNRRGRRRSRHDDPRFLSRLRNDPSRSRWLRALERSSRRWVTLSRRRRSGRGGERWGTRRARKRRTLDLWGRRRRGGACLCSRHVRRIGLGCHCRRSRHCRRESARCRTRRSAERWR
jgi:hypothetical protein